MTAATMIRNEKAIPEDAQPATAPLDPGIQSIIDKGRSTRVRPSTRATWVLPGVSALLLWSAFTPLNFSPLAWLALVPLCLLIRCVPRTRHLYRSVWLWGFVWSLMTLQWMRLGHPTMYVALLAMSIYMACYLPLFVALSRVAVHRLRVPLLAAVPIVWTGLEFVRAYMITGFSWYYLGHSQYRWTELIQISDLVGAYGVSFVVAMVNAGVCLLLARPVLQRLRLWPVASRELPLQSVRRPAAIALVCVSVVGAVLAYGYVRRGQAAFTKGPRVAAIQGNFTPTVKGDPRRAVEIIRAHDLLTRVAVMHGFSQEEPTARPELIIWPETMFPWPLFELEDGMTDQDILRLMPAEARVSQEDWVSMFRKNEAVRRLESDSRTLNAAMLVGIQTIRGTKSGDEHRNSVAFVTPQMGFQGRYDKMHLVMFGEYIPFQDALPFLSRFTPYGPDFGLEPGREAAVFEYAGATFAPMICFEDTVPHLVRGIARSAAAAKRPIDFFVNATNDGWFHGSSELDQHLITSSFRCVETRTPMVRAVNTGISAFIDGDGVIRDPEVFIDCDDKQRKFRDESGRWTRQLNAVLIDNIPLDGRHSLYVQTGDVFAGSCGLACLLIAGIGLTQRRRKNGANGEPGSSAE